MKKAQIIAAAAGITVILTAAGAALGYRAGYSSTSEETVPAQSSMQDGSTTTEPVDKATLKPGGDTSTEAEPAESPDNVSSSGDSEMQTRLSAPDTGTYSLIGKDNIPTTILCHVTESETDGFRFSITEAILSEKGDFSSEETLIPESDASRNSDGTYEYSDGDLKLIFIFYSGSYTAVGKSLSIYGTETLYNMDNYYTSAEYNGIPGNVFSMVIPTDIITPAEDVPEDTQAPPADMKTASSPVSPQNGTYFATHLSGKRLPIVIHLEDSDESSFRFYLGQITDEEDGTSTETVIFPERTAYYTESGYYEYESAGYHIYFKYNPKQGEEPDRVEMYGLESLYDPYQYILPMQYKGMSGNMFNESLLVL